jgi:hypothetical protein
MAETKIIGIDINVDYDDKSMKQAAKSASNVEKNFDKAGQSSQKLSKTLNSQISTEKRLISSNKSVISSSSSLISENKNLAFSTTKVKNSTESLIKSDRKLLESQKKLISSSNKLNNARRSSAKSSQNATSSLDMMKTSAMGLQAFMGGVMVQTFMNVTSKIIDFGKSMIDQSAKFETLRMQFETLIGDADLAKEKFRELVNESKVSPFTPEQFAKAAKVLQGITRGAFASTEAVRLVGDAAAVSGEDFASLAMHVGRAYGGLQANRPVGESLMRLQELGIVSGETRNKIEDLQKAGKGKDAWEVLRRELELTKGGMEKLAGTIAGKESTVSGNFDILKAALSDATGLTEKYKESLDDVNRVLESTLSWVEKNEKGIKEFSTSLGETLYRALPTFIQATVDAIGLTIPEEKIDMADMYMADDDDKRRIMDNAKEIVVSIGKIITDEEKKIAESRVKSALGVIKTEDIRAGGEISPERGAATKLAYLRKEYEIIKAETIKGDGDLNAVKQAYEIEKNNIIREAAEERLKIRENELIKHKELLEKQAEDERKFNQQNQEEYTKLLEERKRLDLQAEAEAKRLNATEKRLADERAEKNWMAATTIKDSMMVIADAGASMIQDEKERATVYKAIASFETAINTYTAAQKAFTALAYNPPLAAFTAGAVTVAGLARVAKINAETPKFSNGGIVPGTSFSGDQVDIKANSNEMINTTEQQANMYRAVTGKDRAYNKSAQQELFQIASGYRMPASGGGNITLQFNVNGDMSERTAVKTQRKVEKIIRELKTQGRI